MRLMSVTLTRYKRFEERTEVDVAGDVVALVGPNEAGKSTVLDAMLSLEEDDAFSDREQTRETEGIIHVAAGYVLDDADRDALGNIPGGKEVRWWTLDKWTSKDRHSRYAQLHPAPQRDLRLRHRRAASLQAFAGREQLTARFHEANNRSITQLYSNAVAALSSTDDTLSAAHLQAVHLFAETMFLFSGICDEPALGSTSERLSSEFCAYLRELRSYDEGEAPRLTAGRILQERRPTFLAFTGHSLVRIATYGQPTICYRS